MYINQVIVSEEDLPKDNKEIEDIYLDKEDDIVEESNATASVSNECCSNITFFSTATSATITVPLSEIVHHVSHRSYAERKQSHSNL